MTEYIRITKENIDKEHICCTMSGKQSIVKKEWLKQMHGCRLKPMETYT